MNIGETVYYFKGGEIFSSIIAGCITKETDLSLIGNTPSCGLWNVTLGYGDGTYYLLNDNTMINAENAFS